MCVSYFWITLWPFMAMNEVKWDTTSATTPNANLVCSTVHHFVMCFSSCFFPFFFLFYFVFASSSLFCNFVNYGIEINDRVHLHFSFTCISMVFQMWNALECAKLVPFLLWLLFIYSHSVHFRFSFTISINCDLPFITHLVQYILSFRCPFAVRCVVLFSTSVFPFLFVFYSVYILY